MREMNFSGFQPIILYDEMTLRACDRAGGNAVSRRVGH